MGVCKLSLCMIFMLCTLIQINDGAISLSNIQTNITLTANIVALDLQSTKTDILTTANDLRSRINHDGVTTLFNTLIPKLQKLFPTNQLTTYASVDATVLATFLAIAGVRNSVSNALMLLNAVVNDLSNAIVNLGSISSGTSNNLAVSGSNLQSILQDTLIQLNSFSDIVFTNMTNNIQTYITQFNGAMDTIQQAVGGTQVNQNTMANQIDIFNSLLYIQKAFGDLTNSINQDIFSYISTVTDANSGILTPLLSTLSGTISQIATCNDCSLG